MLACCASKILLRGSWLTRSMLGGRTTTLPPPPTTTTTTHVRFRTTDLDAQDDTYRPRQRPADLIHPVYVHHVSKITLEYLQNHRSDWLVQKGLDRGLRIHPNGTFVLNFPARKGYDSGRIWYVRLFSFFPSWSFCPQVELSIFIFISPLKFFFSRLFSSTFHFQKRTSYDSAKKQHLLSVYRHKLAARYLLRSSRGGNDMVTYHNMTELKTMIYKAVDQMIASVDQIESQRSL